MVLLTCLYCVHCSLCCLAWQPIILQEMTGWWAWLVSLTVVFTEKADILMLKKKGLSSVTILSNQTKF